MSENKFDVAWKRACELTGWKQKGELADFLGIKRQSVSGARKRGTFPLDWAYRIAGAYDANTDWILDQRGTKHHGRPDLSRAEDQGEYDYIPMVEAQLSAGDGAFVISETMREHYAFRKDWLRKTISGSNSVFLVGVTGNSMEPTIYDGDIVMLDTGRTHIYDGNIYALRMDDTIMVKRLSLRPGDSIQVISDNKHEYESYETDRSNINVIAQVVWFARALVRPE